MSRIHLLFCHSFLACLALFLVGCGGGGGASFGGGIGGTGKTVLRKGVVTATNDVTVGGQAFDTAGAAVTIGGMAATPADIRVGMVALLHGTDTGGVLKADSVTIEEVVKGLLEAIIDANTITVQGQTVQIDGTTVWGPGIVPASAAGLVLGDHLEVYGFTGGPGVVRAARVERESSLSEFRLQGIAASVNTVQQTFMIGAQKIDYAGADTSDLAGGHPTDGQVVEARGLNALNGSAEFVATEVKKGDLEDEADNDDTEVEGLVTAVNSATQFVVSGVTVTTNGATQYVGGVAADVGVGVRIEAEGGLAAGTLLAAVVKFEDGVKLESDVATRVGNTMTLVGFAGLTITVNSLTTYDGNAAAIGDVLPGDHVRIRGRPSGATSITAASVKETGADTKVELQGPVAAVPAPSDPGFVIFGVAIDTTGFLFADFKAADGTGIGRAAFFAAAVPGQVVEAGGDLVSGVAVFNEVELEGE